MRIIETDKWKVPYYAINCTGTIPPISPVISSPVVPLQNTMIASHPSWKSELSTLHWNHPHNLPIYFQPYSSTE
ncbi:hypothetical protein Ocin01_13394 [Orchesella cincta]|uniref:Uncharacterized protein n=1 Tax=Orchesella cincta TaxID=48709 RepID=A0A1D2MJR8_ORCCI|nr:hypothetical protein Ocin01_13394 [Orchesella cincta]